MRMTRPLGVKVWCPIGGQAARVARCLAMSSVSSWTEGPPAVHAISAAAPAERVSLWSRPAAMIAAARSILRVSGDSMCAIRQTLHPYVHRVNPKCTVHTRGRACHAFGRANYATCTAGERRRQAVVTLGT